MFPAVGAGVGGGIGSPGRMSRRGAHHDVPSWPAASGGQAPSGSGGLVKGEMSNGGSSGEEDPHRKRPREWRYAQNGTTGGGCYPCTCVHGLKFEML